MANPLRDSIARKVMQRNRCVALLRPSWRGTRARVDGLEVAALSRNSVARHEVPAAAAREDVLHTALRTALSHGRGCYASALGSRTAARSFLTLPTAFVTG